MSREISGQGAALSLKGKSTSVRAWAEAVVKASSIIPKGEVYESHIFTKKEEWFKSKAFTREVKEMFTEIINCHVKEESEKLSVF